MKDPYKQIKRLTIILGITFALLVFISIEYALGMQEYSNKQKELIELKKHDEIIIGSLLQFADYQQGRIYELKSANNAWLKYGKDANCMKAIKKTPLPKMQRG